MSNKACRVYNDFKLVNHFRLEKMAEIIHENDAEIKHINKYLCSHVHVVL